MFGDKFIIVNKQSGCILIGLTGFCPEKPSAICWLYCVHKWAAIHCLWQCKQSLWHMHTNICDANCKHNWFQCMITNCHVTLLLVVSCRRRCVCAIRLAAQYQFKNCWYFNCDQLNWMFAACCARRFSQLHKAVNSDFFYRLAE